MYIDTHCHITRNDYSDIPFLIDKIKKCGINKIIVNGCDMQSNLEVLELTKNDIIEKICEEHCFGKEKVPFGMIFPINKELIRDWNYTDIYMNIALD